MTRLKKSQQNSIASSQSDARNVQVTFREHVGELRGRLTWVAIWFVVITAAVFPFYLEIIKLLMQPLGNEKLYYLTPIGGVGFAIKVCMYVGIVSALPILVYHLYRFVSPVMKRHSAKHAAMYMLLSALLAVMGVLFAYVVSLPSALKFLTGFNIGNISAMLTVDSYLSFIITYVLANAIMFQIPLLMVIIDKITPMPPSKWNKFQRHMVVGAFIIAMLISPSPELTTQAMIAAPVIVMYQLGIGLVWLNHRVKRGTKHKVHKQVALKQVAATPVASVVPATPVVTITPTPQAVAIVEAQPPRPRKQQTAPGRVDVLMRYTPPKTRSQSVAIPQRAVQPAKQSSLAVQIRPEAPSSSAPRVTMDGVFKAQNL